jgi:hypothetical protein
MLGALHDVDERAFALATRQVRLGDSRRTPLRLPPDPLTDRAIRWGCVALIVLVAGWRVLA